MKHTRIITLSLATEVVCPFDESHRFPLRDGLAAETLKALAEDSERTLKNEKDKVRKALIAEFDEEKKRIRSEAERSQSAKLESMAAEKKALQDLLQELRQSLSSKAKTEVDLRNALEDTKANQEAEISRALAEYRRIEREKLTAEAEQRIESAISLNEEKMKLQVRQLELQKDQALRAAEDLRRRMGAGSQQLQGEALELEVETFLLDEFPSDKVTEVSKGSRGADVIQEVKTPQGSAGRIIWECKVTKNWSDKWIAKIKQDMLASGGELAVIVSSCLPEDVTGFGMHSGVWVCTPRHLTALSHALRYHVIELDRVRKAGRVGDKTLSELREFIIGPEFSARVGTMTQLFVDMEAQISKERSAYDRQWKLRESQIRSIKQNFGELYGSFQGLLGEDQLESPKSLRLQEDTPAKAVNQ